MAHKHRKQYLCLHRDCIRNEQKIFENVHFCKEGKNSDTNNKYQFSKTNITMKHKSFRQILSQSPVLHEKLMFG